MLAPRLIGSMLRAGSQAFPKRFCAGRINVVSVGDQDDVIIDPGFKNASYVVNRDRWKNRTGRCFAAIYGNQYRNLLV